MSRGGPPQDGWSHHPHVVAYIWSGLGEAEVVLFASRENAQCTLWFSLSSQDAPPTLELDAFVHLLLYTFPPVLLFPRFQDRMQKACLSAIHVAPGCTIENPVDTLSQVGGTIRSYPLLGQYLWAWPLRCSP